MEPTINFKTPCKQENVKLRSGGSLGTPVLVPASPFMQKLGYGTGVSVYLMKRAGKGTQSPWAVKKINSNMTGSTDKIYQERLNEEAEVLKTLQHPNIVGFRAFATSSDGSKCLAMEYGGEQSLNDLIEKRREEKGGPFPASTILQVALCVARGLLYLHNEKRLLHGDIKSGNIVIKGDFESIKICDVGVCLKLNENMQVTDPNALYIGTEPWKPKEALEDGIITDKSDVFAYGLTLWEMMTLCMPHLQMLERDDENDEDTFDEEDFDEDAYYEALGTRPILCMEEFNESYQKAIEIFWACTNEDPNMRPSAAQIVKILEDEVPDLS
ncbi:lymphokine-activated killer T-cell-originated protein kinase homolog [Erpetoichthys calabaricus]|uniref:PDZ binding kinase n=1 Tax=Erpetoichthys calabaricus TaxID=27687 RepID=A0A8C4RSR8_ERPCA|nr:lymphokine-activated killer T-cell-originated protein kinase homolog [Erpetoichthys calabaricus]XP_028653012.1 lymphokine-activated killer T-cell-originated protein kinase homolog [Erpetoichthys calabaricus]